MRFKEPKRNFEKSGLVSPERSYFVQIENVTNTDNQDIKTMVDLGRYFSIFAPRQSGKTTFFSHFCDVLQKDPNYIAIFISFQRYGGFDGKTFYRAVQNKLYFQLSNRLQYVNCPQLTPVRAFLDSHELTDSNSFYELFDKLNEMISFKKIVIFIDEFDGMPVGELENFLITLRELYQEYKLKKDKALYSVGLIGIRNITRLVVGGVSPFNIADQVQLPPFNLENIRALYSQYTEETNQPFEEDAIKSIQRATAGQPWLVNRLGTILTVNIKPKTTDAITAADVDAAVEHLVLEDNNHFDNLLEKINSRKAAFRRIAFGEVEFNPVDEDQTFLRRHGVIRPHEKKVVIANPIYRERFLKLFRENNADVSEHPDESNGPAPGLREQNRIFISYSHRDEEWKDRLMTHLGLFKRQNLLDVWEDRRIKPGEDFKDEIQKALSGARVAVLLISANFLDSNFIFHKEIPALLQKRREEGLQIIPIIVKPCAWKALPWLSSIQVAPKDGTPLMKGAEYEIEEKLAEAAETIASAVNLGSL